MGFNIYFDPNKQAFDLERCTASFSVIKFNNKLSEPILTKDMSVEWSTKAGRYSILKVTLLPEGLWIGMKNIYIKFPSQTQKQDEKKHQGKDICMSPTTLTRNI